jgi:hypothetical protein
VDDVVFAGVPHLHDTEDAKRAILPPMRTSVLQRGGENLGCIVWIPVREMDPDMYFQPVNLMTELKINFTLRRDRGSVDLPSPL